MHKSKHSKFKNTGILFELLTRQVTADILAGKNDSKAKDILFKYFKENTQLGKEWQLYNFLVNEQFLDEVKADRALCVVLKAKEKINTKKLIQEKYELIKEIKDAYPIDKFLKSGIKNYKVYASIYKIFESHVGNTTFRAEEVFQAKNCLLESLVSVKRSVENREDDLIEYYRKESEEVRLLAYKFLVENLNKKYSSLNADQKEILKEYINGISNVSSISNFIIQEKNKVKNQILSLVEKIDSQVIKIKINEVLNQLSKINTNKGVKDNHVMVLLLSHELIKEIQNNTK
jgi:hypothetical protein